MSSPNHRHVYNIWHTKAAIGTFQLLNLPTQKKWHVVIAHVKPRGWLCSSLRPSVAVVGGLAQAWRQATTIKCSVRIELSWCPVSLCDVIPVLYCIT